MIKSMYDVFMYELYHSHISLSIIFSDIRFEKYLFMK